MDRWRNRVALVTGASAGIGAGVCELLSDKGMKVIGCARRVERIEEMAKDHKGIWPYKCDLRDDDQVKAMFSWIASHPDLGRVDVCVANAGLSTSGSLLEGTVEDWRKMSDVNVIALCLCVQLSIKSMLQNNITDGQVFLVNSVAGHKIMFKSKLLFYTVTKHAVSALTAGFRQELRDRGNNNIRVCGISPGLVKTDFQEAMYPDNPEKVLDIHSRPALSIADVVEQLRHVLEMPAHVDINDILMRPVGQHQ